MLTTLNKQAIAKAFSKAAHSYDQYAHFQRQVGAQLLAYLPSQLAHKKVVDLGCGTGFFTQQLQLAGAEVFCVDLTFDMLKNARNLNGDSAYYLQADAEHLPLADHSCDLLFSNLAVQWCSPLAQTLSEIKRVLKPQSMAVFSTLLTGSLTELKQAWLSVDDKPHINSFLNKEQIKLELAQAGIRNYHLDCQTMTLHYQSARSLMKELKGIGANYIQERSNKTFHRQALLNVEQAYQAFRNQQGWLPATYQVCFGVIYT